MVDCNFTVVADEQPGNCLFTLSPFASPEGKSCEHRKIWSSSAFSIPRNCFVSNMSDEQASLYDFSLTQTLPEGATALFDGLGNLTFTPSPLQEPSECGSSSIVFSVNVSKGEQ